MNGQPTLPGLAVESSLPQDEAELMVRASGLAGRSLGELAQRHGQIAPLDLRRKKGFVGELIERALGLARSSAPAPDFEELGIELKTLPVSRTGRVLETTYVCRLDIDELAAGRWDESRVKHKLSRVLFVPVQGEREVPVPERLVGAPFLWSADPDEELLLRADWEDVAELCAEGLFEAISARRGHVMQVRPKAANAATRSRAREGDKGTLRTLPRGFYLRTAFTAGILARQFTAAHPSPNEETT